MACGDRGGFDVVVRQGGRFRRRRGTLPSRFEEMTVVVWIVRVSLAGQIFVIVCRAFVKEVVLSLFGREKPGFKLRILGGQAGGVVVGGRAAEVEPEGCVYSVEGEGLSVGVVDQGDCFRGLLGAIVEIDVTVFFVREGKIAAIVLALRARSDDRLGGRSGELWPVVDYRCTQLVPSDMN